MRLETSLQQQTRFLIPVFGNSDCLIFLIEAASSAKSPKCAVEVSGKSPQETEENPTSDGAYGEIVVSLAAVLLLWGALTRFFGSSFLFFLY